MTPPAKGVVHIKDTELIKGEKPIDAIRVKVAGIEKYTQSAARKIERLALEFENKGFHVAIIAGASPQYIDVAVEGIGLVRESWTTLGAAGTIIDQWNMTSLLLRDYLSSRRYQLCNKSNACGFVQVNKQADTELL